MVYVTVWQQKRLLVRCQFSFPPCAIVLQLVWRVLFFPSSPSASCTLHWLCFHLSAVRQKEDKQRVKGVSAGNCIALMCTELGDLVYHLFSFFSVSLFFFRKLTYKCYFNKNNQSSGATYWLFSCDDNWATEIKGHSWPWRKQASVSNALPCCVMVPIRHCFCEHIIHINKLIFSSLQISLFNIAVCCQCVILLIHTTSDLLELQGEKKMTHISLSFLCMLLLCQTDACQDVSENRSTY